MKYGNTYSNVEFTTVYCVIVAIEGLNAKISSDIPQAHGFVATAADENLTEGLELNRVHTVYMTSKREPGLFHIHVPKLNSVIHTT